MQLENKIAIVTGTSSGLGAAISKALIRKGAEVYDIARNKEKLDHIQNEIGKNFHPVSMDITDEDKIRNWVDKTFNKTHSPQILINNAGYGNFSKIDETSSEEWLKTVDTNLNAIFHITSSFVPFMKKDKESTHIINIGSILGTIGQPKTSAYSATKFAVRGFSEALFKELREFNIKVTCVNPGSIETSFFKESGIIPHHNMLQPEDLAATIIHLLETPDNMLIDEITIRPLHPKKP